MTQRATTPKPPPLSAEAKAALRELDAWARRGDNAGTGSSEGSARQAYALRRLLKHSAQAVRFRDIPTLIPLA